MRSVINNYAPRCALPNCINRVGYHKSGKNVSGTLNAKWKMFCEPHRTTKRKVEVEKWKLRQGCANVDKHYGFACGSIVTLSAQLDINHKNGDRYLNTSANLECLCKICHTRVTLENKHHKNRYNNTVPLNPKLWEVL